MTDYWLRADGLDHLHASLIATGLASEGDDGLILAAGVNLDVIGEIRRIETDEDGNVTSDTVIPGCHANLRLVGIELTQEQQDELPLIPAPNHPYRVWA